MMAQPTSAAGDRPRNLPWYLAGPMLYGDWGTSRFYVLGLAYFYALHASLYYVIGVGLLVAAVGYCYTIVCRCYPDGGGVYSAARQVSPLLAMVGATLLLADYIVTAAISAFEAMHYVGVPESAVPYIAAFGILLIGGLNVVGTRNAGRFALFIAVATLLLSLVLAIFTIPHLGTGLSRVEWPKEDAGHQWLMLVNVVLALSGVEAIANMTGVMKRPVGRTARRAIIPVMLEVVLFNVLFAIGLNALHNMGTRPLSENRAAEAAWIEQNPNYKESMEGLAAYQAAFPAEYQATVERQGEIKVAALRVMAHDFVGPTFAAIAGIVFGLLLMSAVNTAVVGLIGTQYAMARDKELPSIFAQLNRFGVPWLPLLPAIVVPFVLVLLARDLAQLADLYAIGVVGAIAINLSCCTINQQLRISKWERRTIGAVAVLMVAVWITLAAIKLHALMFVAALTLVVLGLRFVGKRAPAAPPVAAPAATPVPAEALEPTAPDQLAAVLATNPPRVMVATRGNPRTLEFAANYCGRMKAVLFVVFVRQINLPFMAVPEQTDVTSDPEAMGIFAAARKYCAEHNVAMVPIYATAGDVAELVVDLAATNGVDTLLLGVSQKGALLRALQGDVMSRIAERLPSDMTLLIHA